MAEAIGALRADLSANAASFASDMVAARNAVLANLGPMGVAFASVEAAANKSISAIASLRTAAAALAASGFVLAINKSVEFADNLGKTAARLGITTDALQELQFAARAAGVSTDDLSALMGKLSVNIGKSLGDPNGQEAKIFGGLKISLSDLKNLKPDQLLGVIADQMNKITDANTRNAYANALFGKSWAEVTPLLQDGSDGLDIMRQKAEDLGLVLSGDTIKQAHEASDQLSVMGAVIQNGLVVAALQFLPLIQKISEAFQDKEFLDGLNSINTAIGWLVTLIEKAVGLLPVFASGIRTLVAVPFGGAVLKTAAADQQAKTNEWLGFNADGSPKTAAQNSPAALKLTINKHKNNGRGTPGNFPTAGAFDFSKDAAATQKQTQGYAAMIEAVGQYGTALQKLQQIQELQNEAVQKKINLDTDQGKAWMALHLANLQEKQDLADVTKIYQDVETPLQAYNDALARLNQLHDQGSVSDEAYGLEMDKLHTRYVDAQAGVEGLAGAGKNLGDAMSDAFDSMIDGSKSFGQSLNDLVLQLAKVVEEALLLAPLKKELEGFATDLVGGGGSSGSGGAGGILGALGGFIGSLFGGGDTGFDPGASPGGIDEGIGEGGGIGDFISGFASGGTAMPGSTFWVGEKGPELMKLGSTTAAITPNDQAMGGAGNVYQIDARGADQGAVRRIEQALIALAGPGKTEQRVREATARGSMRNT